MIHIDDIKVISANAVCMILLHIQQINYPLQTLVLLTTFIYTAIRTVNEIQKYKDGKAKKEEDRGTE